MTVKDHKPGTVLFACTEVDDEAIADAKKYCAENNLTKDDVKLVITYVDKERKKPDMVLVIKK